MIPSKQKRISILVLTGMLSASSLFAAGFEKSQTWSAAAVGQASAVVGSIKGAEALYFNPAGLQQSSGREVSLNFSPTLSKFSGANPYQTTTPTTVDGKTGFSPIGALVASYKMNEDFGLGIGYYVSGGTKAKYESLNYTGSPLTGSPATFNPTIETDLAVTEAALGAGYQIMPGFRVGAAWRVVMVDADFSTVIRSGVNDYVAATVSDIKATRWNAYKLGAQYESPDRSWGLGANYRSTVKFIAEGDGTRYTTNGTAVTSPVSVGKVDIENAFPQQIAVGGFVKTMNTLRVSTEYSFTNYSDNKNLFIRRGLSTTLIQNWKNQHIGRLGFEYTAMNFPIRVGYAYTSQVTPSDYARSTFSSPGSGHAISAGTGMVFSDIDFDVAAEYSFASGQGRNLTTANPLLSSEVPTETEFKSHAYAAHLSAKFHF